MNRGIETRRLLGELISDQQSEGARGNKNLRNQTKIEEGRGGSNIKPSKQGKNQIRGQKKKVESTKKKLL